VAACEHRHGRLTSQNGIALILWPIGTDRLFAVDNGNPAFLDRWLEMTGPDHSKIYGDFDYCRIWPDTPGAMGRVCVVGMEKLVVAPDRDNRAPFRLLKTWPRDSSK
jgi:hypothetical protein